MDTERFEILLSKFYSKQLSAEEKIELEYFLKNFQEARKLFHQYNFVHQSTEIIARAQKTSTKSMSPAKTTNKYLRIKRMVVNAAAILALPLLIAFVYSLSKNSLPATLAQNEVTCTKGRVTSIKLSDGSLVHLFAGSTLKYPSQFTSKERSVQLEGEAAFEVHANPNKPFYVRTDNHESVKAYGTKFIVSSYTGDSDVSVYLEKGKVDFAASKLDSAVVMYPKTRLVYDKKKVVTAVKKINCFDFDAYKQGGLVFADTPLKDISRKLTETFGVNLEVRGDSLQNTAFTASFSNESLLKILDLLKIGAPKMKWMTSGDKIVIYE